MPSEMKGTHQAKEAIGIKSKGFCTEKTTQVNAKSRLQLILPPSHCTKAIEGCHNQVGILVRIGY